MSYYQDDYEDVEYELGEYDEASRSRPRPRYAAQGHQRRYMQPTRPGAASNGQVSNAFQKVGGDVLKLAEQLKALEARVDANQATARKNFQNLGADLQQTKMFSALLPMLSQPKTLDVAADVVADNTTVLKAGDKLVRAQDNTLATVLPLLLLSQGPGMPGAAPGGADNTMMLLVLALTLGNK